MTPEEAKTGSEKEVTEVNPATTAMPAEGDQKQPSGESPKPPKKDSFFESVLRNFLSFYTGKILVKQNFKRTVPFILFLTFLGILYIANTYFAEKTMRAIEKTQRELKELRYEHITTKSELMFLSKQSEVLKRLEGSGLKESRTPPEKIVIGKDKKGPNADKKENNSKNQ